MNISFTYLADSDAAPEKSGTAKWVIPIVPGVSNRIVEVRFDNFRAAWEVHQGMVSAWHNGSQVGYERCKTTMLNAVNRMME